MQRVLFVCLGNICRSPLAKWIFLHEAGRADMLTHVEADSCGLGSLHEGEGADPRSVRVALQRGVPVEHTARQIRPEQDFARFDLLIAMDRANVSGLRRLGAPDERVRLMRSFDPSHAGREPPDVPDPYTGTPRDFERVFDMLVPACAGLIEHLRASR